MVVKNMPYVNPEGYLYEYQKRKIKAAQRIKKQIKNFGLNAVDLGISIV
jgi:transposase